MKLKQQPSSDDRTPFDLQVRSSQADKKSMMWTFHR